MQLGKISSAGTCLTNAFATLVILMIIFWFLIIIFSTLCSLSEGRESTECYISIQILNPLRLFLQ